MINKDDFIQKSIINDMSEGVMIIGLDGNIKYINPAALSILNKNEAEMTGKNFASVFFCDEKTTFSIRQY